MRIMIDETHTGVGCIDLNLVHDDTAKDCKQGLKTKLRIQADPSTYMTSLAGINEDGTWLELDLQGIESIGLIEALHYLTGELLVAVKNKY